MSDDGYTRGFADGVAVQEEHSRALAERAEKAEAEVEALKHDIERHLAIASSEADYAERLHKALRRLAVLPLLNDAAYCVLCKGSWAHDRPDGEWHESGCLATPSAPKEPQQKHTEPACG